VYQYPVQKADVKKLVGQTVYAMKKDGSVVSGKLVKMKGNQLFLSSGKKKAATKAILPLVLFDLLAIGTSPFAFGFPGFGFPGFGFPGFGFPGFF
jgi:hypothetical protein